jgi:hypothetical protein
MPLRARKEISFGGAGGVLQCRTTSAMVEAAGLPKCARIRSAVSGG